MCSNGTPEPQKARQSISQAIWARRYQPGFRDEAARWKDEVLERVKTEPVIEPELEPESPTNAVDPQLSAQGYVPHTELYGGLWSNVSPLAPSRTTN
jgi:hypothetical protein